MKTALLLLTFYFLLFAVSENKTILDTTTGLTWSTNYFKYNGGDIDSTIQVIKNKIGSTKEMWRLPMISELKSYSSIDYSKTCVLASGTNISYIYNIYYPYSNLFFTANRYDINSFGHNIFILLVKGEIKETDNLYSHENRLLNVEIEKYIDKNNHNSIGFVPTKIIPGKTILIPNGKEFQYFNYCPKTAYFFANIDPTMKNIGIKKYKDNSLTSKILDGVGYINHNINLWDLKGFYDFYASTKELDEFELNDKMPVIIERLNELNKLYKDELSNMWKSTFFVKPQPYSKIDYDIDKKVLKISLKNDYYPYGLIMDNKLYPTIVHKLDVNKAKNIFSFKNLKSYCNIYVKLRSYPDETIPDCIVNTTVIHVTGTKEDKEVDVVTFIFKDDITHEIFYEDITNKISYED